MALDFYTWNTPNGQKVYIALEEMGVKYDAHPIHIGKDEQFSKEYVKINPNSKIPAIVDASHTVFESGAILIYLAETYGQAFLPQAQRVETLQWLMFQMAGIGPMYGQAGHFLRRDEKDAYAIKRYTEESKRLTEVLEGQLKDRDHVAGGYSIADMALYPWVTFAPKLGIDLDEMPRVKGWLERVEQREAVGRAMERAAQDAQAHKEALEGK